MNDYVYESLDDALHCAFSFYAVNPRCTLAITKSGFNELNAMDRVAQHGQTRSIVRGSVNEYEYAALMLYYSGEFIELALELIVYDLLKEVDSEIRFKYGYIIPKWLGRRTEKTLDFYAKRAEVSTKTQCVRWSKARKILNQTLDSGRGKARNALQEEKHIPSE